MCTHNQFCKQKISICCSFTLATETKSGRIVKTPGKFSACVSGKRKMSRSRKPDISGISDTSFKTAFVDDGRSDVTASSLFVNTSQGLDETTICDSIMTQLDETDTTIADDLQNEG